MTTVLMFFTPYTVIGLDRGEHKDLQFGKTANAFKETTFSVTNSWQKYVTLFFNFYSVFCYFSLSKQQKSQSRNKSYLLFEMLCINMHLLSIIYIYICYKVNSSIILV